MAYRPTPLRLLRGHANVLVWKLPLPARVLARISTAVYRNPPFPAALVTRIAVQLEAAGIDYWLSGGWGLDALLGRQSRTHDDLDLVVAAGAGERAVAALAGIGFSLWYQAGSTAQLGTRIVLRDHPIAGHAVDLHPLECEPDRLSFDTGTVGGMRVPCLDIHSQLALHSGYRNANYLKRRRDRADAKLLQSISADREQHIGARSSAAEREGTQ